MDKSYESPKIEFISFPETNVVTTSLDGFSIDASFLEF